MIYKRTLMLIGFVCLLFMLLLVSCVPDPDHYVDIEGSYLKANKITVKLPVEYIEDQKIVFKNSDEQEKTLIIVISNQILPSSCKRLEYTWEEIIFSFIDKFTLDTLSTLTAFSTYSAGSCEIMRFLTATLVNIGNGPPPSIELIINPSDDSASIWSATYHDTVVLNGVQFTDVFSSFSPSTLYLNLQFGLIGFVDTDEEFWVFDRFEE